MRNSKIDNVINLTASERYDYFIRKVADFEEVWGLKDAEVHIPADTRSAFPVISVQSPVSIQCCWQS